MLQEYDPENEALCSFITKDGKESVVLNSNLCFFAFDDFGNTRYY